MSTSDEIKNILVWSENNKWFNTDFVKSVQDGFNKYEKYTDKQKTAIHNIYTKCNVEKYFNEL